MRAEHSQFLNHAKDVAITSHDGTGLGHAVNGVDIPSLDHVVNRSLDLVKLHVMGCVNDPGELDDGCIENGISMSSSKHDSSQDIVDSFHIDGLPTHSVVAEVVTKCGKVASMWDLEERKVREEFLDIVHDWSSGNTPSVHTRESTNCDGCLGCVSFDSVC
jgi:hypothetical protein